MRNDSRAIAHCACAVNSTFMIQLWQKFETSRAESDLLASSEVSDTPQAEGPRLNCRAQR